MMKKIPKGSPNVANAQRFLEFTSRAFVRPLLRSFGRRLPATAPLTN